MELYEDPNDAVEVLNLVVGITGASVRKPSSNLNANKLQFYVGSGHASREPVTMSCNRDYPDRRSLGPRAKEYVMHQKIDDEIRARCW